MNPEVANDGSDEDDNSASKSSADEENENDYIDSGDRGELSDVILAFTSDEEVERPAITHSGRANNTIAINMPSVLTTLVHSHVTARAAILEVTRRSEIDFFIFGSSTNSERAGTFLF